MFSPETTEQLALVILALLAAGLVFATAISIRRTKFSVSQYFFYLFGKWMSRILWRAEVHGRLPIDEGESAVIVCNHRSPWDPAFIQLATDRVVHWMVAREYCTHWAVAWFFNIPQAIPVGRAGIDTAATKLAIRYAKAGDLVGMLPEGRINTTDDLLLPGRPGAAMVALKARVPIVICYVSGTPAADSLVGTLWTPSHARLVIGPKLDISEYYGQEKDRTVLETLTKRCLKEIAKLAGNENYEPKLAGRRWRTGE